VVAEETVSLFGLIISSGNKVNFAKRHHKNVVIARDIFIQSALLQGEILGHYAFLQHNQALINHWQEVEEKLRVRSIIVDEGSLYRFYSENIPADVYDQATLNRYLKKDKSYHDALHMTDGDVLKRKPDELELIDYPPSLPLGPMEIRLEYHFEPGSDHDGVTFRLPVDFASSLSPTIFEWLVPGLLPEKLTFLLKALPKTLRKKLVPISDTVNWLLDDMLHGHGSLYAALEASLLKRFKILVQREDWTDNLPLHLQPRFVLFSDDGQEICAGRNLLALQKKDSHQLEHPSEPKLSTEDENLVRRWKGTEHKEWGFQGLAVTIPTYTHSGEISGFLYPVLLPQPDKGCVVVDFEKNKKIAEQMNRQGTLFLYRLQFAEHYKILKKTCSSAFSGPSAAFLLDIDLPHKAVVETFLEFLLSRIFSPLSPDIIEQQVFLRKVEEVRKQGFLTTGKKLCDDFLHLLRKRRSIMETIEKIFSPGQGTLYLPEKRAEFIAHLDDIFPRGLLRHEAEDSFTDLDRQLQCLSVRIERYYADPAKDSRKAAPLIKHLQNLQQLMLKKEDMTEEARACAFLYKTMVNEYRIALFSPEIRTRQSISEKKLEELWRRTQTRY